MVVTVANVFNIIHDKVIAKDFALQIVLFTFAYSENTVSRYRQIF